MPTSHKSYVFLLHNFCGMADFQDFTRKRKNKKTVDNNIMLPTATYSRNKASIIRFFLLLFLPSSIRPFL